MSKIKNPASGEGYLGEIMVHRLSHAIGVVESVIEGQAGWPPQITLKLKDGVKKGRLSDFRDPSKTEREKFSPTAAPVTPTPAPAPAPTPAPKAAAQKKKPAKT